MTGAHGRAGTVAAIAFLLAAASVDHPSPFDNARARWALTRAIVEDGELSIDRFAHETGDRARRGDHYYCDKAPGVSVLAVPFHAAFRAVAAAFGREPDDDWARYLCRLAVVSLPAAWMVRALAIAVGALGLSPAWAGAVALACGVATPVFPYATLFYGHVPAAALALLCVLAATPTDPARLGSARAALAGLAAALAVAVEYPLAVVGAVGGGAVVLAPAPGAWRRAAGFALGAFVPLAALALYHHAAFGAPWATGYAFLEIPAYRDAMRTGVGGVGAPTWTGIVDSLVAPGTGLFAVAPWLALAGLGLGPLGARAGESARPGALDSGRVRVSALASLALVLVSAGYFLPGGGWATGPRHLVPAMPLLAWLVARALRDRGAWARVLFTGLALSSAARMLLAAHVEPHVPDAFAAAAWSRFWWPLFAAGFAMPGAGTALGLDGPRTLLPALAVLAAGVVLLVRWAGIDRGRVVAALGVATIAIAFQAWPMRAPAVAERELASLERVLTNRLDLTARCEVLAGYLTRCPSADGYLVLAAWREVDGARELALDACARAHALAPADPAPLAESGRILERAGRRADALAAYRDALALDPACPPAVDGVRRLGGRR